MKEAKLEIIQNYPLGPLTTFNIGGPARYFVSVSTEEALQEALQYASTRRMQTFILGSGSNILVSDRGFSGLVISNRIFGFDCRTSDGYATVRVCAGEDWDRTVQRCVEHGWSGLECLSGIPGTIGAAPIQNIGAYGQNFSDVVTEVRAIDRESNSVVRLDNTACEFRYRESIFNTKMNARYVVTGVTLRLAIGGRPTITYQDLKDRFADTSTVTLAEVREAVIEIRSQKGMVLLPGHPGFKSVGSFFKNPIISLTDFEKVQIRLREPSQDVKKRWFWMIAPEQVKISAAYLIEHAGFHRGCRQGRVGISPRHSLALVNYGGGTAEEMVALAGRIQQAVYEKFGVLLKPEAQFVGFSEKPLK
ncbi:MAG TPA: UDP-N-acetylmuramate dehydrogenase [Acidobacteriota bacterium]